MTFCWKEFKIQTSVIFKVTGSIVSFTDQQIKHSLYCFLFLHFTFLSIPFTCSRDITLLSFCLVLRLSNIFPLFVSVISFLLWFLSLFLSNLFSIDFYLSFSLFSNLLPRLWLGRYWLVRYFLVMYVSRFVVWSTNQMLPNCKYKNTFSNVIPSSAFHFSCCSCCKLMDLLPPLPLDVLEF